MNLYAVILSLYMAAPTLAQEVIPPRSPLSYSLREYGLILAIAMLGGFVRWYNAVRRVSQRHTICASWSANCSPAHSWAF